MESKTIEPFYKCIKKNRLKRYVFILNVWHAFTTAFKCVKNAA